MPMHSDGNKVPEWLLKSRQKWRYKGQERPPFAEMPKPGQRSVWDFPRPPALVLSQKEVEVRTQGVQLAFSSKALELLETASPPTYYLPPEDVALHLLEPLSKRTSLCEWKGEAHYWALKTAPEQAIAWSYAHPFEPYEGLRDYLAFYPQHFECTVAGEKVIPQPGGFYAGWITHDLCGPFKGDSGTGHW